MHAPSGHDDDDTAAATTIDATTAVTTVNTVAAAAAAAAAVAYSDAAIVCATTQGRYGFPPSRPPTPVLERFCSSSCLAASMYASLSLSNSDACHFPVGVDYCTSTERIDRVRARINEERKVW